MSKELSTSLIEHEDAVGRLCNALDSGGPRGRALAREHLGSETPGNGSSFTIAEAERVYARRRGFDDWRALRAHVFERAAEDTRTPHFQASRAIHAGDAGELRRVLDAHPQVLTPCGGDGPLLVTAVGAREPELVRILLDAGCDTSLRAPCGCGPLHRAGYGHPPEPNPGPQEAHRAILDLLLDAGLETDESSHGAGGTPLVMALFWGHVTLAERLAAVATVPNNLRVAAGLGDVARIVALFEGDQLLPEAGDERVFYRPHDGFPEWTPSGDPQEVIDEAFLYAAQNGHVDALELLLERGANIDGAPYTGTALHRVAHKGPQDVLEWLLARGASTAVTWGMPEGSTPLHAAAVQGRLAAVRALVEAGADTEARDEAFDSTPRGYAEWAGNEDVVAYLDGL